MESKIDNPKVFISYAWAGKEYEEKVLGLATDLMNDGIQVVIDKWDLKAGNDTNAFMLKSVMDDSITNVLILLDPLYARKADEYKGGVGIETQILSSEVYESVDQKKIVPVVFQRGEDDQVCKPKYLQSRFHFDLSKPDSFDQEYQKLVKFLYGVDFFVKPELGNKPKWVDEQQHIATKTRVNYDELKKNYNEKVKGVILSDLYGDITNQIFETAEKWKQQEIKTHDDVIKQYDDWEDIKASFLELVKQSLHVDGYPSYITEFFEETTRRLYANNSMLNKSFKPIKIRLHELFLYVIAFHLRIKDYSTIGYLLGQNYDFCIPQNHEEHSFSALYSGKEQDTLDLAISNRDNKLYFAGTAEYWMEKIAINYCTKEQLVLADLICYNYTIYGATRDGSHWFPVLYIYDNEHSVFKTFCEKLISQEYTERIIHLFGYKKIEGFLERIKEIEDNYRLYYCTRYPQKYECAPLIGTFIKAKDICSTL